ncbi:hypothetical protein JOL79_13830 [Microbispora sp. RL4-1S]|uniref:DUF4367 domain-containing protein n=1 Tax=Microbispora oryzae TaxID=2806554 RepID=A0A940WP04_9ACTN|nr:hypothetical protein [Microbispora oryzae]MBP2704895.1 hypothetical protein [Microbispora oryzae]
MSSSPDGHDGHDRHGRSDRRDDRFEDLAGELVALGESLNESLRDQAPPPSAVARAVRARIERERAEADGRAPASGRRRPPFWRRRLTISRRRLAVALAVVLAVLLGATPQGRAAVTSVLRFAGVEIHVGGPGPLPTGLPSPLPGERRVTLGEAREAARFPVAVPSALGEPRDVRIADGARVVTLLWPGIRLDEYDGTLTVVFHKELGPPWPDEVPEVGGWWIRQPHALSYVPASGGEARDERVAGPTLIWQRGMVGLRLEGPDLPEALRIARSAH